VTSEEVFKLCENGLLEQTVDLYDLEGYIFYLLTNTRADEM